MIPYPFLVTERHPKDGRIMCTIDYTVEEMNDKVILVFYNTYLINQKRAIFFNPVTMKTTVTKKK